MGAGLAPRVLSGRVITAGVAQSVTRQDDLVMIGVTCMPGHPAARSGEGETAVICLPEPVAVKAGGWAGVLITLLPEGALPYAGPVQMPCDQVITTVHVRR